MKRALLFFVFTLCSLCGKISAQTPDTLRAFPTAEGAGMYTRGGRGGAVISVTNLHDAGLGSLRHAIQQKGARTIVFKLSGTITLKSPLEIRAGDLTIAGQTAPGEGICLKAYPLLVKADNVIIRYLRVRLGDISGEAEDAITVKNQKDIIIDHCSFSWAVDECASFYDNENFTLQWSIISESLNNSVHPKGEHGYGGIWGGMQASFHHNLLAHHKSRNPRFQGSRYHKMPEKERTEFTNNVIYNWLLKSVYGGEEGQYTMIANYFKPGPATSESRAQLILEPSQPYGQFYLQDNINLGQQAVLENNWQGVDLPDNDLNQVKLDSPLAVEGSLRIEAAQEAYERVLAEVGASKARDAVDHRIVEDVKKGKFQFGTKGIIDSQEEVGGWPALKSEPAPTDSDADGMPDAWEVAHQLDQNDAADRNYQTINAPYTNLEVYLHELVE